MSTVALVLNLALAGLLLSALFMGWRLNKKLTILRDSQAGFAKAINEFDAAAARAEHGLNALRMASDEATDLLADRIEKARALVTRLDRQLQTGEARPKVAFEAPTPIAQEPVVADDVERVTHRLGALLSAAREPKPRPVREIPARSEVTRQRPSFEDELFGDDLAEPMLKVAGGARR